MIIVCCPARNLRSLTSEDREAGKIGRHVNGLHALPRLPRKIRRPERTLHPAPAGFGLVWFLTDSPVRARSCSKEPYRDRQRRGRRGSGCLLRARHLDASDVASTSRSGNPTPPDVGTSWHRANDATSSRHGSGDHVLVSAGMRGSGDITSTRHQQYS
jgi:hypothetical protein